MIYHNWKCPECGAANVDNRRCFVVCVSCGETLDKIQIPSGIEDCDQSIAEPGLQPPPEDYG